MTTSSLKVRDNWAALTKNIVKRMADQCFPAVREVDLFLTEDCNLRCDYCFIGDKRPRVLSKEDAIKAVDLVLDLSKDAEEVNFVLFGGEPLLEFELMKTIVAYAENEGRSRGKDVTFSCTTNGTIMNPEMAEFGHAHGFNYLLSIDGDRESHDRHRKMAGGHGTWDVVTGKNFDFLQSGQGWMGTRVTVNPDTVSRLSQSVEELYVRGVNQFLIGQNLNAKWSEDDLQVLEAQMRLVYDFYKTQTLHGAQLRMTCFEETLEEMQTKHCNRWGCSAGGGRIAISAGGEIYPCARFVNGDQRMEAFKLGTIHEGITQNKKRTEMVFESKKLPVKCGSCSYKDYCTGGCYAVNLDVCGSLSEPNPVDCRYTRMVVDILKEDGETTCRCDGHACSITDSP